MAVQNFISRVGPAVSALWYNTADYFQQAPTSTGTSTAFLLDFPGRTVPFVLVDGMVVKFRAHVANGASPTLNVASSGLKGLTERDGLTTLAGTEFQSGDFVWVQYRAGTNNWALVEKNRFTAITGTSGGTMLDFSGTTLRLGGNGGTWTAISLSDNTTITGTLDVSGLATFTGADANGTGLFINTAAASAAFGNLRISNTRVGAGNNALLHLTNGTDANLSFNVSEVGAATKFGKIGTTVNVNMQFMTNNTVQMTLEGGAGKILMGLTTGLGGTIRLEVEGGGNTAQLLTSTTAGTFTGLVWNRSTAGNASFLEFATEGAYTVRGSITYNRGAGLTAYNTTSDSRLKTTINRGAVGIDPKIDQIQVHQYSWKSTGFVGIGCYAQELEAIAPEAVTPGDTGQEIVSAWGVDYSKLVPRLILEVQRLRRRVEVLEAANAMTIPKS